MKLLNSTRSLPKEVSRPGPVYSPECGERGAELTSSASGQAWVLHRGFEGLFISRRAISADSFLFLLFYLHFFLFRTLRYLNWTLL